VYLQMMAPARGGEKIRKKQHRMGYAHPVLLFAVYMRSGE